MAKNKWTQSDIDKLPSKLFGNNFGDLSNQQLDKLKKNGLKEKVQKVSKKSSPNQTEYDIAKAITKYMTSKYPNIIAHHDFGTGSKLTMGQAIKQKQLNPHRGYPDLFIAFPKMIKSKMQHGFYLEIKGANTNLIKRNGDWVTPHIAEQAAMLDKLNKAGYVAKFGIGYDHCIKLIEEYLN